ncbi:polyribonucleotide nucleotidyltransferase 2, mitochondrial [Dorcoceras hygrometricum]|uniref:Polyribonucleotide nucleotidyltransferase 2, mitochondrial n=1 Tax=Dorcoceras hygrometricum TaxID=472368 RepID=A0A2Z7D1H9_9LAMI|nr:polyribonucleotide nucleotidyltransferase 2, mitochondrial [Dorcoceras hygrometricum]
MGSNPSTESNYKTAVNSKNKMQMLCMQPGTTAEGYNQGREAKNSMHSSTEICNRICGHAVSLSVRSGVVSSSTNSFQQLIVFFVITLRSTAVHLAVDFLRIAHQLLTPIVQLLIALSSTAESFPVDFSIRLHQTSLYATQLTASTAGLPRNHICSRWTPHPSTTIANMLEPATTSRSINTTMQCSKLVSIESPKEGELSTTNIAPNGDALRGPHRQSGGILSRVITCTI